MTMHPPLRPSTPPRSKLGIVGTIAFQHVTGLQGAFLREDPHAVAALARLRRGAGKPAFMVQDLWGLTGMEELATALDTLTGSERRFFDIDHAEEALNLAVTLWALHQQSQHGKGMHKLPWREKGKQERRQGLGTAVRELMRATTGGTEVDEPLRKRFVRVAGATSLNAFAQRLRDIVLLLRREAIPLDYGLLADQIYRWQSAAGRADVHREWGRDFHVSAVVSASGPQSPETPVTTE